MKYLLLLIGFLFAQNSNAQSAKDIANEKWAYENYTKK